MTINLLSWRWNILLEILFSLDRFLQYSFYIGIFYLKASRISVYLLRCGGFAVDNHSFTRRRLVTEPTSTRE